MNHDMITKLAYEYLDVPETPNWPGLYLALMDQGCTPYKAQEILMNVRRGDY